MRTPTFDEIEAFLRIDGWSQDRSTGHDFYEKVLPDGETLRSHTSFAGKKTMSPGRFKTILADQLKVSEAEFWEALRSKRPVSRPSPQPQPAPESLPNWLREALRHECDLNEKDLVLLTEDEARQRLTQGRSKPRS